MRFGRWPRAPGERRDGVRRSSGVLKDVVTRLPPNVSPSSRLAASEAGEDPSPLALYSEPFGAQLQLLNNNNNNNPETFSCNICSRGLFFWEETYVTECICMYICFLSPSPNKYPLVTWIWPDHTFLGRGLPFFLPPPMMLGPGALLWGREKAIFRLKRRRRRRGGEDVHPQLLTALTPQRGTFAASTLNYPVLMLQPCLSLDPGAIPSLDEE